MGKVVIAVRNLDLVSSTNVNNSNFHDGNVTYSMKFQVLDAQAYCAYGTGQCK